MPRRDIAPAQPVRELRSRYLDAILNAVEESRRPATRRVYESAWRRFRSWAEAEGLEPLPADPMTVAAYLTQRAEQGLSQSSLSLDRKAISHFHRTANLPTPTISEGVKLTLAGLRKQAAFAPAARSPTAWARWLEVRSRAHPLGHRSPSSCNLLTTPFTRRRSWSSTPYHSTTSLCASVSRRSYSSSRVT